MRKELEKLQKAVDSSKKGKGKKGKGKKGKKGMNHSGMTHSMTHFIQAKRTRKVKRAKKTKIQLRIDQLNLSGKNLSHKR